MRNVKNNTQAPPYLEKLKIYQRLLETWQQKINLVAPSTLPFLWERHFEDSLQLLPYLSKDWKTLIDLGSGAGFPGLVLAIASQDHLEVKLIESDLRKCLFLENVSRETKTDVTIIRDRIENLEGKIKGDVITARALAPLSLLLEYSFLLMRETTVCLFLKGKNYEDEIKDAQKKWDFELEIFPSLTDSRARILKIEHPKRILKND